MSEAGQKAEGGVWVPEMGVPTRREHDGGDSTMTHPLLLNSMIRVVLFLLVIITVLGIKASVALAQENVSRMLESANSLEYASKLQKSEGNFVIAEKLMLEALELRIRALGENHQLVGATLDNLGLLYIAAERYEEARSAIQRAIEVFRRAPNTRPNDETIALTNLAVVEAEVGHFGRAERIYKDVERIEDRILRSDDPDRAITWNNLAFVYSTLGEHKNAIYYFGKACKLFEDVWGRANSHTLACMIGLSEEWMRAGDPAKGEKYFALAEKTITEGLGPHDSSLVMLYENKAFLCHELGDSLCAEKYFNASLSILDQQTTPSHATRAGLLNGFGEVYRMRGDIQKAISLYDAAMKEISKLPKQKRSLSLQAVISNNYGMALDDLGEFEKEKEYHQLALQLRRRAFGPSHQTVALSLLNLAGAQRATDNLSEAQQLLIEARDILSKSNYRRSPILADVYANLGSVQHRQNQIEDALTSLHKALQIRQEILGEQHVYVASAHVGLALAYRTKGDKSKAIRHHRLANDAVEREVTTLLTVGAEEQKRLLVNKYQGNTSGTIDLHLGFARDDPRAAEMALTEILRRKGRVLDAASESLRRLRERMGPDEKKLFKELGSVTSEYARLAARGSVELSREDYHRRLNQLAEKRASVELQISESNAEFRLTAEPITIAKVLGRMPKGSALVELFQYRAYDAAAKRFEKRWGEQYYAVYVLRADGTIAYTKLGKVETIDDMAASFLQTVRSKKWGIQAIAKSSEQIAKLVVDPILLLIGNAKRIFISPDGFLNRIPFGAILRDNNRFLIEDYNFLYLTSGRDLLRLDLMEPSRRRPIIMAAPNFRTVGQIQSGMDDLQEGVSPTGMGSGGQSAIEQFAPLPGTLEEADAIGNLFPSAIKRTDSDANELFLKRIRRPLFLHIATHGFFREASAVGISMGIGTTDPLVTQRRSIGNPLLLSGLALATTSGGQVNTEDGIVTALEVASLDLNGTGLVVLSACGTGLGKTTRGEGIYGLRRALVLAGAQTQVLSLWKVGDLATKELMVAYYRHMKEGKSRSDALRVAKSEMINDARWRHPFNWAAFISSGDWRPLDLP